MSVAVAGTVCVNMWMAPSVLVLASQNYVLEMADLSVRLFVSQVIYCTHPALVFDSCASDDFNSRTYNHERVLALQCISQHSSF